MLMASLQCAAHALGGELSRGQILCPGPGHSPRDRSLAVRFDNQAPGGFIVTSFAGDDWAACRDYVRERLGIARTERTDCTEPRVAPSRKPANDDAARTARALSLWREARRDPRGSPVETYLANRCVALPDHAAGEALRYHPACPFAGKRTPAMVALVRDIRSNVPKAIHRTALTAADGRKAEIAGAARRALGPTSGGAIKLTPDEDVTLALGIAEGIETTLSLSLLPEFGATPVWAVIDAGHMEAFPVLAGIEVLWIGVDHDENGRGEQAAERVAERWQQAGCEVRLITPRREGYDINDIVRGSWRYGH